ncbi:MAG: methyltransferase [Gammaproteobacteria bacterium]|nr:methyltransferase [Gammaproteobacteria bacterium]
MFRLLLINPRFPESFWSFRWALEKILPGKLTLNPPLGLATLAALCPPNWQVQIIDENIDTVPLYPQADLIGVCGMAVQFRRQRELLNYYHGRGYYVIAGGSYASLCPERYHELADTVVTGEAEYTWPRFCRDFEQSVARRLYREMGIVDLVDSPPPRFDLLKLDRYATASIQFSRGCPYRCDFCDIIVMFGRRPRTKNLAQIGQELDHLRSLGVHNVFFVDDNLIGNKRKAKELLRYLADYQQQHGYVIRFGTQASLNLAEDAELLRLFREARFSWIFIGIESPDAASLREINKIQNTRQDILAAVHKIYGYGIDVFAGFIVGFDNDTLEAFDRQYHFIKASGIQVAMIGLLTALPRTPLYERLKHEGRLIEGAECADNTKPGTNFLPKRMDYDTMVQAYKALYRRLACDCDIARRIRNKTCYLTNPVYQGEYPLRQRLEILAKFLACGVFPGGPMRLWWFVRTVAGCSSRVWPQVVSDWITGLAMRDYIKRYFGVDSARERRMAQATIALMRRTYAACLRRGDLDVSVRLTETAARLVVTLRGTVDQRFFTHAVHRIERLLRGTAITLLLRIDECSEKQLHYLDVLLQRLSCYGERVSLHLNHKIQPLLKTDLSVFHMIADEGFTLTSATS